jgi:hypothetical protein
VLLWRGLNVPERLHYGWTSIALPSNGPLWLAAGGAAIFMSGLALLSPEFITMLGPISVFPLAAAAIVEIGTFMAPKLSGLTIAVEDRGIAPRITSLVVISAFTPAAAVFLASLFKPMMARRALLVFVPYVLIVVAAGARSLLARKILAAPLAAMLVTLFVASAWHYRLMPSSPRDYAGIAAAIDRSSKAEDVIFAPSRSWVFTPLFCYIGTSRFVANDYSAFVANHPNVRVWVIAFEDGRLDWILGSLKGLVVTQEVQALGARAFLFERADLHVRHAALRRSQYAASAFVSQSIPWKSH